MTQQQQGALRAPATFEEAMQFAESIAQSACDDIFKATGERPRVERRTASVVVVWPDGEVTNEVAVSMQGTQS